MMPELNDAQLRLLAMDHAIKLTNGMASAEEVVRMAQTIEAYLRGPAPVGDSVQ